MKTRNCYFLQIVLLLLVVILTSCSQSGYEKENEIQLRHYSMISQLPRHSEFLLGEVQVEGDYIIPIIKHPYTPDPENFCIELDESYLGLEKEILYGAYVNEEGELMVKNEEKLVNLGQVEFFPM